MDGVLWSARGWQLRVAAGELELSAGSNVADAAARARRVVDSLTGLTDPRVLKPRRLRQTAGPTSLSFGAAPGTNLAVLLRDGLVSADQQLCIALDVAQALASLHAHGLVHRQLSPEFVFVAPDGAYLCPGEALRPAARADITRLGVYAASAPAFTAPELLSDSEATELTDAWALGVLIHCLSTGSPPPLREDRLEEDIRRGLPDLPVDAPEALVMVYRGLTRASRRERWTAKRAAETLGSLCSRVSRLQGEPIAVRFEVRGSSLRADLPCTVGRSDPRRPNAPDVDLTPFDDGRTVSRTHARLYASGGAVHVEDLESRNGTFVGLERVGKTRLEDGTSVRFGAVEVAFSVVGTAGRE